VAYLAWRASTAYAMYRGVDALHRTMNHEPFSRFWEVLEVLVQLGTFRWMHSK
jgi:hypothetical protein